MNRFVEKVLERPAATTLVIMYVLAALIVIIAGHSGHHPAAAAGQRPAPAVTVSPSTTAGPLPSATTPAPTAAPVPADDGVASQDDQRRASDIAFRWAQAYVDHTGGYGAWLFAVRTYTTPGLAAALATVDRASIPAARVVSRQIETPGDEACFITVRLSTGQAWTVTTVRSGQTWLVSDVTPASAA